jgi:capsular polysaccharide biosynthesis protein
MTTTDSSATGEPVVLRVRLRPWMAVAVLASTLAMAVAGYGLAKGLAPSHVASVDLLVLPNDRGAVDEALVRTFESILTADAFAAEIKDSSSGPEVDRLTAPQVAQAITTRRSPTSSLIEVQVSRPDPESALAIAERISPAVDELLTVGGAEATEVYRQVFAEPLLREQAVLSARLAAAIGGFLGFLLGVVGVLLWSLRRPVVTSAEHIRELSGYPVIARLPDRSSWWRRGQPNILDPLAAAVEQVRDTGVTSAGGVVAVVSPEADASVTFAIEFASLLAQTGDRPVYLVDGNYRTADLTRRLDADGRGSWNRLDLSDETAEAVLSDDALQTFSPVAAGAEGSEPYLVPAARLDAQQDRDTIEQLRHLLAALSSAGVVVVACPPVPGDVPAAPAILAASAVLIVARSRATAPDDVELVGEMVASLSDAPAGVVVIGARPAA